MLSIHEFHDFLANCDELFCANDAGACPLNGFIKSQLPINGDIEVFESEIVFISPNGEVIMCVKTPPWFSRFVQACGSMPAKYLLSSDTIVDNKDFFGISLCCNCSEGQDLCRCPGETPHGH